MSNGTSETPKSAKKAKAVAKADPTEGRASGIETPDLVPLGNYYTMLYDTFGESVFTFLTHRKDDFASNLTV